ncbi:MAG: Trk system potassium transporter TrkA [Deltaproteobacteria bacterium]|nr:MAG: Trk system potassium transporter TrkA [Deltaproteobacteria bacterium]
MNVVLAGLGQVGLHVASRLEADGHALTVIDLDPEAIERAENQIDALTLRGNADAPATLREANVHKADLFAALTSSGPVNIIACLRAKELGAKRVVARVGDKHYFEDAQGVYPDYMGLDLVVNEQFIVAAELRRLVRAHAATSIEVFCDHRVEMLALDINEDGPAVNRPLGDVPLPAGATIAAIKRRDTLLVPNPADMVQVGDAVVCIGATTAMPEVERLFAHDRQRFNKRTFIIGGGGSGHALAEALEAEGTRVVLIERDSSRATTLSHQLAKTKVLLGDGTDVNLLEEAGAGEADVFCAVSGLDEVNLMSALLARDLGAKRCITLVHKPDYVTVCRRLGLNINISPRLLVAREIVRQLRRGALVESTEVLDGHGLVLELVVDPGTRIADKALGDMAFPRGAVVASHVDAQGRVTAPNDDTVFHPGDRVVVFTPRDHQAAVERLFKRPLLGGGG